MTTLPRTMPALVTAFDASGELDLGAHRHNVELITARGARGVVIGGSTGQGPYLEPGERRALVSASREVSPAASVVCGVFAQTVRQALDQAHEAADGGADAILVATPGTLVRTRPEAIASFFTEVASSSPLPIVLYTVPQVTGVELESAAVVDLAAHDGIVGIKDSAGDPSRFAPWRELTDSGFATFVGASRALLEAHRAGAHGAITASANYALTDVSLAVRGDPDAQRRVAAVTGVVEPHGVAGTMEAARLSGLRPGSPRRPLAPLSPEATSEIEHTLHRHGLASPQPHRQG